MQSGGKVCIYAKPQPLFAKLTKLQTLFAKPLEGYFLLFFTNRAMQNLFAKPLEMLLEHLQMFLQISFAFGNLQKNHKKGALMVLQMSFAIV